MYKDRNSVKQGTLGKPLLISSLPKKQRVDKGLGMLSKGSRDFLRAEVLMGLESEGDQSSFRKKLVGKRKRLDLKS